MAEHIFYAAQGVRIPDLMDVHSAYEMEKNENGWLFTVVLDAPRIPAFLNDYCAILPQPGYFTLELPIEGEEAYDIYYVDGCTTPVLQAIVDCYGDLLVADGYVRFGFAAHEKPEQLYVSDLKTIQIYTANEKPVADLLQKYDLIAEPCCKKLWDILSDKNPCELIHVEVEEQSIFDLPALLADAGIYSAGRRPGEKE
ncbi:MAG: hypothetical protein PHE47_05310 [Oscillospiraceae bacterium]|nr:hypothetical protein [Oscillospiraceae bacterium]